MSQFECVRCGKGENECWCKRAQPQAPAPSLDARGDLSEQEIVELDERVAGAKATGWGNAWRWAERLLAEVKRRRAAPSAPSDALRTYGQHLTTHMCSSYDNVKCTCGFDAALAAETAPLHEKVASLEKQLIGALQALQLSERRRSEAAKTGEVNEHEDLELVLFRPLGRVYRVLRCKVCQSEDTFGISLADNGQWNLECGNCYEVAAVLSEVLAKLR